METPKYEQKKIVALVYRQFSSVDEIVKARSMWSGGPVPPATREQDAQMQFVGYVYEGETPEQIINADIEKTNPIRVNEDRQYLVYANPEVHVAEGPKSRVTKVRGFTSPNTFAVDKIST